MPYFVSPRRPIARGLIALLTVVCLSQLARESAAGTVVIGDQSRGVQWKFGGDEPFASSNSQSSPTPQPFDTTVDETDTGGGGSGSARVAATYESVLSASLSEASGDLFVERAGRPAAARPVGPRGSSTGWARRSSPRRSRRCTGRAAANSWLP